MVPRQTSFVCFSCLSCRDRITFLFVSNNIKTPKQLNWVGFHQYKKDGRDPHESCWIFIREITLENHFIQMDLSVIQTENSYMILL